MKKFLSVILSVALLMSMSVTAFAADSKEYVQTVSVIIGEPNYDYTVTMPANCSLTCGNTEWQHIGDITVESENWDNINSAPYDGIEVYWDINSDDHLVNKDGDTIRFDDKLEYQGQMRDAGAVRLTSDDTVGFYLRVPDWSSAVEGTIYKKAITYRVGLFEST